MPTFHHVNLYISPETVDAQEAFLVDVLGYRRVEVDDYLKSLGARWFEADDGCQIHLSPSPHVAVDYGAELTEIEERLTNAGVEFNAGSAKGFPRVVTMADPAGNRWELRGLESE